MRLTTLLSLNPILTKFKYGLVLLLGLAFFMPAWAVSIPESPRSRTAIQKQTPGIAASMRQQGLTLGDPVFIRIVKSSDKGGYLELFVEKPDGKFYLYDTWDICKFSGDLGPKMKTGDHQAPEGFYFVRPSAMNPSSSYHLSFNLGYPNAYDRAHGRTGDYLMVHGQCVSIGCYAMTDAGIEDIYTIMDAAFKNGQPFIRVHAFPFAMTDENLERYEGHTHEDFWQNLKQGWQWFETHKRPPNVTVKAKRYEFE